MSEWDAFPAVGQQPERRAQPRPQRRAMPQIRFADDRDALIRTVAGEAANQPDDGQVAVASVALNRARNRGKTPTEIVLERNQFEPWGNPETATRLMSLTPDNPQYKRAAAAVDRALAGEDPTGGASHFYAPRAQAALGRAKPEWDNGTGRAIGDHLFFSLEGGGPAPAQDAESWDAFPVAEIVQQTAGDASAPMEVEVNEGVRNVDGRAFIGDRDMGPWEDYWTKQRQSQSDRQARVEREADPEYQRALADARRGSENVPDQLRALGLGGTLGFLTDINAEAQGLLQGLENAGRNVAGQEIRYGADMARQAARDAVRDDQAKYAAENPIENFALQAAGGLLTPGLAAGGNYIARGGLAAREAAAAGGATAKQVAQVGRSSQLARAGQVGAAYGALSGVGNSSGSLLERAPDAIQGGGVGALTGVVGQGLLGRLTNGADKKVSNARLLSREGVDLTPGQMVSEVPVIGGMLRSLEEGASSIPFAGAPIAGARQQSVETFNRAAVNRALAPIGGKLPKKVQPGYDAVEYAQNALGEAYDAVLPRVTARLDETMYDDLGRILNRSAEEMDEPKLRQLTNIVQNRVFRGIEEADGVISGEQFKRIESELGALAREQQNALDPANKALGRAIEDVRGAVRDVIARQNPDEAQTIQNINRGYANLVRVEDAAGSSAAQATGGVFSPVQLGAATKRGSSRSQSARGGALLQDLSSAGRDIIPSRVGDSGTATRGAVTGLLAGAASGVPVAGAVAAPLIATSVLYSKPAQAALNAVYRATDSRAAREAAQELARLAQRNPALLPYYEGALEHVQRLGQDTTPNTLQAQPGLLAASPSQ